MSTSLRNYLADYAKGRMSRDDMVTAVAAWSLVPTSEPAGHSLPTHQDNTADTIHEALLLGQINDADYAEIFRRRGGR